MKKILIEWFRYEKGGITCCRCGDSTEVVRSVVETFKARNTDLDVELKEYPLGEGRIDLSNTVRINDRDTICPSCTDLIGQETDCNSYVYKGKTYDSLPCYVEDLACPLESTPSHREGLFTVQPTPERGAPPCRGPAPAKPTVTLPPSTMTGTRASPFECLSISSNLFGSSLTLMYVALSP